ncbi:hypothetical protein X977_5720 [Burkholderia pseudomallei MSHR7504]|nr:hypothetical protein X977_5720 [Burkholderia pseudomallei MSHR7504]VBF93642.1 non-ribosomal peptide synthase [Burkholderia pseudomallei]
MGVFSITPLKNKNPPLGEGLSAIWRSEWSAFSFARRGAARQRLRKLEVAAPAPSFYFNTAAIAFATTSRLRVLSAATQIRPVLTA